MLRRIIGIGSLMPLSLVMFGSSAACAQETSERRVDVWRVEVKDLSPAFMDFYREADSEHASPDRRWVLWKTKYDFAAVPPIPAGQAMARKRLDEAWSKYSSVLSRIQAGAAGLTPNPQKRLDEVVILLKPREGGHILLTAFVGTFHRDAFASGKIGDAWSIAIPLEDKDLDHALDMTHEFTHAIQQAAGHWEGQTVGGAVFTEGLAMRTTEKLNPGYESYIYTTSTVEWLRTCEAALPKVLDEIQTHLNDVGAEAVSHFTFEKGAAGLEREVYCAGWFVVGRLLDQGRTLHDLASLSQTDAIATVAQQLKTWPGVTRSSAQ